ncbi:MAG: DUF6629 family protein [Ilumatobacteraceae bacterium]
MCFSATADIVGGVIVGGIGVDALRHAHQPAQRLLASVPFVFAAHQLIEAVVWGGLRGNLAESAGRAATWAYLAIAFGIVPILVPVAVAALEPAARYRRMAAFTTLGTLVAGVLMYSVIRGPITAEIEGHHIAYDADLNRGGLLVALYVVATCGSLLASHHLHVRWFGAINLVVVVVLAWVDQTAFVSLWCAWAAATSLCIALHLRGALPRAAVVRRSATAGASSPAAGESGAPPG